MGGAFGHLEHPYDVEDFTFKELTVIVNKAFGGELEYVQEKTDGQNICISWRDGRIIFARNKSHLKNAGSGAMDLQEMICMFSDRGTVSEAFKYAGMDLHDAICKLSKPQRDKVFKQGKKFMSLEIMYTKHPNIILYDKDELRFHGTFEYNEAGEIISQINKEDARMLAGMLHGISQHKQTTFHIQDLKVPTLPRLPDYKLQAKKFVGRIDKLRLNYDLTNDNHLHSYKNAFWMEVVNRNPEVGAILRETLVLRWARGIKKPTIAKLKKDYPEHAEWIMEIENNHKILTKQMMMPFDRLFLEMGAVLMKDMTDLMVINTDRSVEHIMDNLVKVEADIATSKDPANMVRFKAEAERLEEIGGATHIIPSEGITFIHKGRLLKLTGTFAPINQLLGLIRFAR